MARIFLSLSLFSLLLIVANYVVGLYSGDFNGAAAKLSQSERALRMRQGIGAPQETEKLEQQFLAAQEEFEPLRRQATIHILLGLGAALVCVLVNSITVTYFIGTNRWCREVSDTYALGDAYTDRSNQLKRKAFPWSIVGILTTMLIVAFGAASDPSALGPARSSGWVSVHFIVASMGVAVIGYAMLRQVAAVGANYEVIQEILVEVQTIRKEKGLE